MTVLLIVWFTLVQRMVPSRFLGRVSSLDWMLATAGTCRYNSRSPEPLRSEPVDTASALFCNLSQGDAS